MNKYLKWLGLKCMAVTSQNLFSQLDVVLDTPSTSPPCFSMHGWIVWVHYRLQPPRWQRRTVSGSWRSSTCLTTCAPTAPLLRMGEKCCLLRCLRLGFGGSIVVSFVSQSCAPASMLQQEKNDNNPEFVHKCKLLLLNTNSKRQFVWMTNMWL